MTPPPRFQAAFPIERILPTGLLLLCFNALWAQQSPVSIALNVRLDTGSNTLSGTEEISLINTSETALKTVFLHAWANAYRDKNSDLTQAQLEHRKMDLYFAPRRDRGYIRIKAAHCTPTCRKLAFTRKHKDILQLTLLKAWRPGDTLKLAFDIKVKIPNARFTGYGFSSKGYRLKYWYLIPAVYRGGRWQLQTDKNLDDLYALPTDYRLQIQKPRGLTIASDLKPLGYNRFQAHAHKPFTLSLFPASHISTYRIPIPNAAPLTVQFDYSTHDSIADSTTSAILGRALGFLERQLGHYPFHNLLLTAKDYESQRFYGVEDIEIDLINRKLRLFKPAFGWEMNLFKQLAEKYLDEALFADRRRDHWLYNGIKTYLQLRYIERYYHDTKLTGNAADFKLLWIKPLKWLHLTRLSLDERYRLLYLYFARLGFDQPIKTPLDEMTNLNKLAISGVKTALGLRLLNDYIGGDKVDHLIKQFYNRYRQHEVSALDFERALRRQTHKDLRWFFDDYLQSRKKIDYKLIKYREKNGQYQIHIKNKSNFVAPLKISAYQGDSLIKQRWYSGIRHQGTVLFPKGDYTRLALNDRYIVPEINNRNNFIQTRGLFKNKRKLQFKPFGDIEDPQYNQVFFLPEFTFNNYDKVLIGLSLHNQAILKKPFNYKFKPMLSTGTGSLSGRINLSYDFFPADGWFQNIHLSAGLKYFHYDKGLPYTKITPTLVFNLRKKHPRSDLESQIILRHIYVDRKTDAHSTQLINTYKRLNVFNLRYNYDNPELPNGLRLRLDNQIGAQFGKVFTSIRYQRQISWQQRISLRLFAGSFLYNRSRGDFFNFGLDHIKDYLVDYSLLGRSERSGLFYQQFVMGQGGFKSSLKKSANQWMLALNADFQLWKIIGIYGDVSYFKNRHSKTEFAYDSGIKLEFIPDFIALYFPIQSSLGFEPGLKDYEQRIRFTLVIDLGRTIQYIRRGLY